MLTMKTLDELLECLRVRFDDGTDPNLWGVYIDMIKSAVAREREAVTDCNHPGNAAAMREALDAALPIMRNCVFTHYNTTEVDAVVAKMEAALSAPARNCDRFTYEVDAQSAFLNEMLLIPAKSEYVRWLFSPATERKGEN